MRGCPFPISSPDQEKEGLQENVYATVAASVALSRCIPDEDGGRKVAPNLSLKRPTLAVPLLNTPSYLFCTSWTEGGYYYFGVDGVLPLEGEHAGLVGAREGSIPHSRRTHVPLAMYHDVGSHQ